MSDVQVSQSEAPLLKLNFLSHGTLESRDLELSRKFYEECLGLQVVRTSNISLLIKLGGDNTIAVVQSPKKEKMPILNHNGLDVESQEEVNVAHELLAKHKDRWGVTQITKPALQHGTYSFFFCDIDENWWEILTNPRRGYAWLFEKGDQEGRGHMDKSFDRPGID